MPELLLTMSAQRSAEGTLGPVDAVASGAAQVCLPPSKHTLLRNSLFPVTLER